MADPVSHRSDFQSAGILGGFAENSAVYFLTAQQVRLTVAEAELHFTSLPLAVTVPLSGKKGSTSTERVHEHVFLIILSHFCKLPNKKCRLLIMK